MKKKNPHKNTTHFNCSTTFVNNCEEHKGKQGVSTLELPWQSSTVKLGLYVHGLVHTLGYNVLSVDYGHRQSQNMYFYLDKTYRTWHNIGYYVPTFPSGSTFCPFFGSFFWSRACHPLSCSFNVNFSGHFQVHDAVKDHFTVQEASNDRHSGRRSIFRGGSLVWTRTAAKTERKCRVTCVCTWDRFRQRRKSRFGQNVLRLVCTFLHFPWGYVITEFHCACKLMQTGVNYVSSMQDFQKRLHTPSSWPSPSSFLAACRSTQEQTHSKSTTRKKRTNQTKRAKNQTAVNLLWAILLVIAGSYGPVLSEIQTEKIKKSSQLFIPPQKS